VRELSAVLFVVAMMQLVLGGVLVGRSVTSAPMPWPGKGAVASAEKARLEKELLMFCMR
jgi:hypothetical protein